MLISKVTYRKTFNLGSFQSEAIGVEIDLNEGESATEALDTCSQLVNEYHQKTMAELDEFRGTKTTDINPIEDIQVDKVPDEIRAVLDGIEACTGIAGSEGLGSYWLRSKGNLVLSTAYKAKEKQLTNAK